MCVYDDTLADPKEEGEKEEEGTKKEKKSDSQVVLENSTFVGDPDLFSGRYGMDFVSNQPGSIQRPKDNNDTLESAATLQSSALPTELWLVGTVVLSTKVPKIYHFGHFHHIYTPTTDTSDFLK